MSLSMIPRGGLDIAWSDLLFAAIRCALPGRRATVERRVEAAFLPSPSPSPAPLPSASSSPSPAASPSPSPSPLPSAAPLSSPSPSPSPSPSSSSDTLVCLSVRSALDLFLRAMAFEKGSEILVSAVTIRDMIRIIEHHELVAVPVDLDMETLTVRTDALERALTPRTKAILVAHLFGSRMPLGETAAFARAHGLALLEDCAQSFTGTDCRGDEGSDVTLFSFGPIKTATALGGAIVRFSDARLRERMKALMSGDPVQGRWAFFRRTVRFALARLVLNRWSFGLLYRACRLLRRDHDELVNQAIRGFSGPRLFTHIRRQPSYPLLALLHRRLSRFDRKTVAAREAAARRALELMPTLRRPGTRAAAHAFWTFPVQAASPDDFSRHLWRRGFDATRGTWSLYAVPAPAGGDHQPPAEAAAVMREIVYLPVVYPGVGARDLERLADSVREFTEAEAAPHVH